MKRKLNPMIELILGILALGYLGGGAFLYNTQEDHIFPARINEIDGTHLQPYVQNIAAPDGTVLNGVVIESKRKNAPLVLAFGGNAHDVTGFTYFLHHDVFLGEATVIGFSYRNYPNANGKSGGMPTQKNVEADAVFLYDHFTQKFQPQKVLAVGYSLGTAIATYVATKREVSAIGLVAPFTSIGEIAAKKYWFYPTKKLLIHPFNTVDIIAGVSAHTLILAADNDGLIPPNHPKRLLKAATGSKQAELQTIPNTHHGSIVDDPTVPDRLRPLLDY